MIFEHIYATVNNLLGLDMQLLSLTHMAMRGLLVFVLAIFMIKANTRFIGQRTQFNFILFIMLGSVLAAGITGNAPFLAVMGMVIILIFLNWLLIKLSFYSTSFEKVFKGKPTLLVHNGTYQWPAMQSCSITADDLLMQLRIGYGLNDIDTVKEAYMESNGALSFVLKEK